MLWLGEQLEQRRVVYVGLRALVLVPLGVTAVRLNWLMAQLATRTLVSQWIKTNLSDVPGSRTHVSPGICLRQSIT